MRGSEVLDNEKVYGFGKFAQSLKPYNLAASGNRQNDRREDVLSPINAAKSALHKAGQVVLEGHLKHCVRDGIENGDADKTIESFAKKVERFANMK